MHRGDINRQCRFFENETGCQVDPKWTRSGVHSILSDFLLFGKGTQVTAATRLVNKWIETANQKTAASSAWAKTPAFNFNKWYYAQITEMEADRKLEFLLPLHEDAELPHKVISTYDCVPEWSC